MTGPQLKVLVVDDEPPIRKLLRMGLATANYQILEAPNGKTALAQLAENPDLVILDLGLPDMDGHELLRTIRSRNGGLPFVKALGFKLHSRDLAQVSMNLTNYEVTGMTAAYDAVRAQANVLGVEIESAEIVGLVPRNALDRNAAYFPKLENFTEAKILEYQIDRCSSV